MRTAHDSLSIALHSLRKSTEYGVIVGLCKMHPAGTKHTNSHTNSHTRRRLHARSSHLPSSPHHTVPSAGPPTGLKNKSRFTIGIAFSALQRSSPAGEVVIGQLPTLSESFRDWSRLFFASDPMTIPVWLIDKGLHSVQSIFSLSPSFWVQSN